MLLDLNKLHGRQHVERRFEPAYFDPQDEDFRVARPVALSMEVQKAGGDTYDVKGHLQTALELDCSRCLEPFLVPVDATFELRYVPQAENTGEPEREIQEEDLTTAFHREGLLDVTELLREQFQLALPMKPLCKDDCRGLCSACGTNLNKTTCDCAPKWEDPRLAPLKSLLNRNTEN
jgi:uncharacterized protein